MYILALGLLGAGPSWGESGNVSVQAEEPSAPQIAASPTPLFIDIGPRASSGAITLFNLGKKDVTVQATVVNFDLDEKNAVRVIPPTPQSMDLWMIVNPINFTIPAGKAQTVRISVRPPVKPDPGEHRAMVFFTQKQDQAVAPSSVNLLFQVGVAVYGMAEGGVREGIVNGITMEPGAGFADLVFDITCTGNAGVRMGGQYTVWPKDKFNEVEASKIYTVTGTGRNVPAAVLAAGALPDVPVFPGTRRTIRMRATVPQDPGNYVVHVYGMLGGKPFKKSFDLTAPKR